MSCGQNTSYKCREPYATYFSKDTLEQRRQRKLVCHFCSTGDLPKREANGLLQQIDEGRNVEDEMALIIEMYDRINHQFRTGEKTRRIRTPPSPMYDDDISPKSFGGMFGGRLGGGRLSGGQLNGGRSGGLSGGRSGGARRWVQNALRHSKKGLFSKKAARQGLSTQAFACKVLHEPGYDVKTKREAQFYVNINKEHKC